MAQAPSRFLARSDLSSQEIGRGGERFALFELTKAGYGSLASRIKTRQAELDLVLVRDQELFVVEVKTGRAGQKFRPRERFTRQAQSRQWKAARALSKELGLGRAHLLLAEVARLPGQPPVLSLTEIFPRSSID